MSRRSHILAAALVTIGTIALASTAASALPGNGFATPHGPVSGNAHVAFKSGPIGGNPISWSPKKQLIGGNPISWTPQKGPHNGCTGQIGCNPSTWTPQWHQHHPLPYFVAPVVATEVGTPAIRSFAGAPVQRTADTCSCLTKDYLPDGSVMFKDLCTKEAAVASPNDVRAQAGAATQTR